MMQIKQVDQAYFPAPSKPGAQTHLTKEQAHQEYFPAPSKPDALTLPLSKLAQAIKT